MTNYREEKQQKMMFTGTEYVVHYFICVCVIITNAVEWSTS